MKKKLVIMALCLAMATFGLVAQASAKTLKLQCAYPQTAYAGQSTQFFADEVKKLTGGKLEVKIFWPGQLVKTNEAFDAVRQGMIDAYSGSLLYFAGLVPEVNCQWLPFNWDSAAEAKDIFLNKGYMDIMAQSVAKHGVTYLGALSVATMGLMTKFPVNTLEDLSGKKIRAVGMEAKIMKALGAAAVAVAGAEQYMALQRGTVEGTDYPWYTIDQYKFYEVLSDISAPALHTPGIIEIVIGTDAYSKLPADQQEALKKAAMAAMDRSFDMTAQWDKQALDGAAKHGIKITTLSDAELAKFRAAVKPLWDEAAKASENSGKLVEIMKANLQAKGVTF